MTIRLNKVTRDLNVGITTVVEFLQKKGFADIEVNPNTKITEEQYALLVKEFSKDKNLRLESEKFIQERQNKDRNKASISIDGFEEVPAEAEKKEEVVKTVVPESARPKFKPVGKIDLESLNKRKPSFTKEKEEPVAEPVKEVVVDVVEEKVETPVVEVEQPKEDVVAPQEEIKTMDIKTENPVEVAQQPVENVSLSEPEEM